MNMFIINVEGIDQITIDDNSILLLSIYIILPIYLHHNLYV